ncbi:uncharacterized protein LOC129728968 [Wyeomyia smithii]|uniref:uncharacterized protein LOC129728968 n=1 Tax=Wyeomyia smithii TaxID=174621 RepID=UPI002467C170|nr:uncharacterized protein LOC129728968 [Wyeomyia smithii]XP_055543425.1 uncharacterized protein LOC129728968 [Wyeomyia smithii]
MEESPPSGNLSYRSNEPCMIDIPLNLAPVNRSEKTEPVRGNACVPLNLATTSRSASAQSVFHPPISDVYLRSPLSPLDMKNNELQTGFPARSLQAAYTPMDQEQLPVVNNQCQPGTSSKKFKAVHSDMSFHESTETSNEARQMIDEYFNSGSDDENDYDHDPDNVGDATMLNEFAYFNDAFIGDKDEFTNEHADERVAHEAGSTSAVMDPGFEELKKENVVNRPKSSYRKRMENKIQKEKGLQYNRYNGITVPARSLKKACSCSKLRCGDQYPEDIRQKILKNFLMLSISGQNQFLSSHMAVSHVTGRTVINSQREYSVRYFLPGVGGMVRVCKAMILGTLDITSKKMRCITVKKLDGLGISADDKRVENCNRNPIGIEAKQYIESHILSYPAYTSHYNRKK